MNQQAIKLNEESYSKDVALAAMVITEVWDDGIERQPELHEFFEFIYRLQDLEGLWTCRQWILDELAEPLNKMWEDMDEETRLEIGDYDFQYSNYWLAFVFPSLLKEKGWDTNTPTYQ